MPDSVLLREILEAQLELVCRFEAGGTILFANRAYSNWVGMAGEPLAGHSLWQFVVGEDRARVEQELAQLSPDNVLVTIENRIETVDGPRWMLWRNHALAFDHAGRWAEAQSTGIDITSRKQLEDQLQMVVEELNHRVKNTLMVVQSLAWQTFRHSGLPGHALAAFNERLGALASAHGALSRTNWAGARLIDIVNDCFAVAGEAAARCRASGPDVTVPARLAVPLTMTIHELATNAIKYGALSSQGGNVALDWTLGDRADRIALHWREAGGPPVGRPGPSGFGTRLITETVTLLGGTVDLAFPPGGLDCRIAIPLEGQGQ